MTSNLGTPQLHEAMLSQQAAWEAGDIEETEVPLDTEAVEEIVGPVVQSRLRPELLGRVDGTCFFRPLVPQDIRQIAVMALSELAARVLDSSGGRLELRPHSSLIELAVEGSAASPQYGARGVQRAVQRKRLRCRCLSAHLPPFCRSASSDLDSAFPALLLLCCLARAANVGPPCDLPPMC
jgi:ATP-dependent Clp protease ATP-binding subunit ClpA